MDHGGIDVDKNHRHMWLFTEAGEGLHQLYLPGMEETVSQGVRASGVRQAAKEVERSQKALPTPPWSIR